MKVVLDTNILVSSQINIMGLEYELFSMAVRGDLQLLVSEGILSEYTIVLNRKKFRFKPDVVLSLLKDVRDISIMIEPQIKLTVSSDPKDNKFLECAEAGNADFLVTGNLKHFPEKWQNTHIVNARMLFERFMPLP